MADIYKLNKADGMKILNGFIIALIGAGLTFLVDLIPSVNFGVYTPVVVAIFSTFANAVRKWLTDADGHILGIGI
jgi:hypothetical protein